MVCGRRSVRRSAVLVALVGVAALATLTASAATVKTLHLGDTLTVTGQTGSRTGAKRAVGTVVVRGRWNGGSWYIISTTHTDRLGHYRVVVTPTRRGYLDVRIMPPDRFGVRYLLHVI